MSTSPFTAAPDAQQEDRAAAILSYITIIGFIVAIILHSGKKTAIGSFHLRQVLGFIILGLGVGITAGIVVFILAFIPVVGPLLSMLIWIGLWGGGLVLWVMGLIAAIQGKQTPVPVIGAHIQKWFANVFN
ncbi:MAG: hypothetical protein H7Y06_02160 [Opitutaceae bacterium]|nr:hypothetical protein [Opitutaceae bacterium]